MDIDISNDYINHEMKIMQYIIRLSLYMYLLVDTIAGILISRHLPNIGQVYKILVVLLMLIYVISKKRNLSVLVSFLFSLMFIIPLNFIFSDFANFSQSIMILFKSISIFIFYEFFQSELDENEIDRIFMVNYIVFILNIIAGRLGFARGTYSFGEESVGTTGFFYAGNEVTFTFICLTFWFLIRTNIKKSIKYIVSVLLSVMIGTKAGMLGVLLIVFCDMYYSAKPRNRPKILLFSICLMTALVFLVYTFLQDNSLYRLIAFKLKQHSRGNMPILNALLSGRIERLPVINEIYEQNFSAATFVLGMGFPLSIKRIEMDFFEYFYYFGFLAFILICLFYINILYISWKKNNKRQFWFNVICIVISFLAGHIVYSVMGGVFFAMINAKSYKEEMSIKNGKSFLNKVLYILLKTN